jgi:hypothetical protein
VGLSEEVARLRDAIERLKQVSSELKIGELVAQLRDIVDDLYHYVSKDAEHFFIKQVYGGVKVCGRYFEFYVDKASLDMTVKEVYNMFFNNVEVFLTMMKQAIALLHDVVELLSKRLDVVALIREAEQALSKLQQAYS